ncbi:magnesium transporter [Glycomyces sp. TRM65418]|uniref:magnesium transporter n=1 Tax=Glycomyces sp. TRM65418 TaxID=2867006 RepID=UPI001CE5A78B|nr:magnesium transporter [Glycomyces sp. TRM65418]MCC3765416.1 magnesium transporter [Glycomyces sp. TRM65418]QZD55027.1 magnesium transporter [Glycomyces sp. TRM65418]
MAQTIQPISPAAVDSLAALRLELADTSTVELAEELPRMDIAEQALRFRLLPKDRALAVFEELDTVHQQELIDGLKSDTVRELLESMEADDRAKLFDEMPAKVATRFQSQLSAADRRTTAQLLGYDPESAGRIMTPDYVSLRASMTAAAAIERIRHLRERPRHLDVLPVTDGHRKLLGTVTLADLVSADPDTIVADLIADEHYQVSTDTDQEEAARLIQEANLIALAVVDHEDRLVGMITWDDAMEVLEAEDTEDVVRGGASEPLERPYLSAGVFMLARKRAVWLLILAVSASLTVTVLDYYESYLNQVTMLALFVSLLTGTGGNSGSQASVTVIRAMAVGEVRFSDVLKIVWREARVGFLLGAMLALVGGPVVGYLYGWDMGLIIACTLLGICTWSTFVGSFLPLAAKKIGIDPALVSAPMVSTLCDATGLIIYFSFAALFLGPALTG